ncbi:hypothetical protein EYF80_028274 [Liparis tanakae]|uniref:Uncharacterized protein n=1 Tax=Liparis tanakae TaxID=230148 RepID=A0A4Z2H6W0_9TELE|nr:hypothetical protein EYF80_028274 [Liparis tanakae]
MSLACSVFSLCIVSSEVEVIICNHFLKFSHFEQFFQIFHGLQVQEVALLNSFRFTHGIQMLGLKEISGGFHISAGDAFGDVDVRLLLVFLSVNGLSLKHPSCVSDIFAGYDFLLGDIPHLVFIQVVVFDGIQRLVFEHPTHGPHFAFEDLVPFQVKRSHPMFTSRWSWTTSLPLLLTVTSEELDVSCQTQSDGSWNWATLDWEVDEENSWLSNCFFTLARPPGSEQASDSLITCPAERNTRVWKTWSSHHQTQASVLTDYLMQ